MSNIKKGSSLRMTIMPSNLFNSFLWEIFVAREFFLSWVTKNRLDKFPFFPFSFYCYFPANFLLFRYFDSFRVLQTSKMKNRKKIQETWGNGDRVEKECHWCNPRWQHSIQCGIDIMDVQIRKFSLEREFNRNVIRKNKRTLKA